MVYYFKINDRGPVYEFSAEICYPIAEQNASGILVLGGCVVSILEGFIFTYLEVK